MSHAKIKSLSTHTMRMAHTVAIIINPLHSGGFMGIPHINQDPQQQHCMTFPTFNTACMVSVKEVSVNLVHAVAREQQRVIKTACSHYFCSYIAKLDQGLI